MVQNRPFQLDRWSAGFQPAVVLLTAAKPQSHKKWAVRFQVSTVKLKTSLLKHALAEEPDGLHDSLKPEHEAGSEGEGR